MGYCFCNAMYQAGFKILSVTEVDSRVVFKIVTFGEEERVDALAGSSVFAVEYSCPSRVAESGLSSTHTQRSLESIS